MHHYPHYIPMPDMSTEFNRGWIYMVIFIWEKHPHSLKIPLVLEGSWTSAFSWACTPTSSTRSLFTSYTYSHTCICTYTDSPPFWFPLPPVCFMPYWVHKMPEPGLCHCSRPPHCYHHNCNHHAWYFGDHPKRDGSCAEHEPSPRQRLLERAHSQNSLL